MGIPATGKRSDSQGYILRELEKRYGDEIEFVYPADCVQRIFHDFARNAIVEEFRASNCDVLWFLDSDVTPPKHILDLVTLYWDKWKVAGAAYPVFMTPQGEAGPQLVFTAYQGSDGVGLRPTRIPHEGQELVDGLATGCMFIKKEIFEVLERPYFEHKYNPESRQLTEGEDLGFCMKLNKLGIRFFTDYSMVCRHYKEIDLLEMNNYAMDYCNKGIRAYDQTIRGQIVQLEEHYRKKLAATHETQSSRLILPSGLGNRSSR